MIGIFIRLRIGGYRPAASAKGTPAAFCAVLKTLNKLLKALGDLFPMSYPPYKRSQRWSVSGFINAKILGQTLQGSRIAFLPLLRQSNDDCEFMRTFGA